MFISFLLGWDVMEKESRERERWREKNGYVKLKFAVGSPQQPHCFMAA